MSLHIHSSELLLKEHKKRKKKAHNKTKAGLAIRCRPCKAEKDGCRLRFWVSIWKKSTHCWGMSTSRLGFNVSIVLKPLHVAIPPLATWGHIDLLCWQKLPLPEPDMNFPVLCCPRVDRTGIGMMLIYNDSKTNTGRVWNYVLFCELVNPSADKQKELRGYAACEHEYPDGFKW